LHKQHSFLSQLQKTNTANSIAATPAMLKTFFHVLNKNTAFLSFPLHIDQFLGQYNIGHPEKRISLFYVRISCYYHDNYNAINGFKSRPPLLKLIVINSIGGVIMSEKKELDILVGNNIKRERTKAGYTQEQFSELIGIGTKSLSAIERGTVGVSLTTLLRICKVLSISSNSLLFENTPKNDVQDITGRLERLTPAQFEIAKAVLCKVIEAFSTK
jgi:transcriptional regulator with XRE-family HTH domain